MTEQRADLKTDLAKEGYSKEEEYFNKLNFELRKKQKERLEVEKKEREKKLNLEHQRNESKTDH